MSRDARAFIVVKMETPGQAGAVQLVRHLETQAIVGFNHACPCGCGNWSWMRIQPEGSFPTWTIQSGSFDDLATLTLSPSIGIKPQDAQGRYHWHGFLENGVFVER